MKIIPLSEGSYTVDGSKQFVPFTQGRDDLQERNKGSLLVEIQPFAVVTSKDIIILDTGLGILDETGQFPLYKNLKEHGIYPDDVTKVILSHLHKDHTGGLLNPFTKHLSFEQAEYYVHRNELAYALETGKPSYAVESIEQLENSGQLKQIDGEYGEIDGYIHYQVTGAHSKYHMAIWIREADTTIFFGADDAPQLSQMKTRFAAKYDYDGKKADALREKWWQEGMDERWTFLFYHDTKNPSYRNNI